MDHEKLKKSETTSGLPPEPGHECAAAPASIDPVTGQHKAYWVLSAEERALGFVRPVRRSYRHLVCGAITRMCQAIAETYASDPAYYGSTFCSECKNHFPIGEHGEFAWIDDGAKVGT
jgi:hypothetical protein